MQGADEGGVYLGGRTAGAGLGGKGGSGFFVPLDHEVVHHQLIDHRIAYARTAQPLRPIRPIDLRSAPTLHAFPAMEMGRPTCREPTAAMPTVCTARDLRTACASVSARRGAAVAGAKATRLLSETYARYE